MGRLEMTVDDEGNISGFYWNRSDGSEPVINLDDIKDVRAAVMAGIPITVWSAYTLLARDN